VGGVLLAFTRIKIDIGVNAEADVSGYENLMGMGCLGHIMLESMS
jgi:hypothetical protein